jgi:hypothetical protein
VNQLPYRIREATTEASRLQYEQREQRKHTAAMQRMLMNPKRCHRDESNGDMQQVFGTVLT